jgi:hypothetical protein
MLPLTFYASVLALTLVAFVAHLYTRRRAARRFRQAAVEWRMHYSETDRFQLTARVAERFPVPGASDFAVYDLLYRQEDERRRYLFTVEYTRGVVRAKQRIRCVGLLSELRDSKEVGGWSTLTLATEKLPLIEQYQSLLLAGVPKAHVSAD